MWDMLRLSTESLSLNWSFDDANSLFLSKLDNLFYSVFILQAQLRFVLLWEVGYRSMFVLIFNPYLLFTPYLLETFLEETEEAEAS